MRMLSMRKQTLSWKVNPSTWEIYKDSEFKDSLGCIISYRLYPQRKNSQADRNKTLHSICKELVKKEYKMIILYQSLQID